MHNAAPFILCYIRRILPKIGRIKEGHFSKGVKPEQILQLRPTHPEPPSLCLGLGWINQNLQNYARKKNKMCLKQYALPQKIASNSKLVLAS